MRRSAVVEVPAPGARVRYRLHESAGVVVLVSEFHRRLEDRLIIFIFRVINLPILSYNTVS